MDQFPHFFHSDSIPKSNMCSLCHSGGALTFTVMTNHGQMIGVGQQLRNNYELPGTHPPSSIHIGSDRKQEVLNLATWLQPLQLFSIKDYRKGHGAIPTFLLQWWYSKIKWHVQRPCRDASRTCWQIHLVKLAFSWGKLKHRRTTQYIVRTVEYIVHHRMQEGRKCIFIILWEKQFCAQISLYFIVFDIIFRP